MTISIIRPHLSFILGRWFVRHLSRFERVLSKSIDFRRCHDYGVVKQRPTRAAASWSRGARAHLTNRDRGELKARFAAVRASAQPTDHRSGSGTRVSNICRATKPGSSANTAPQARGNTTSPICLPRPACAPWPQPSRRDGFVNGPSTTERGTRPRPLRGPILARPSPSCAHDHDRLRLPSASSPQKSEAGKKQSTTTRSTKLASRASRHRRAHCSTATSTLPELSKMDLRKDAA